MGPVFHAEVAACGVVLADHALKPLGVLKARLCVIDAIGGPTLVFVHVMLNV